MLPEERIYFKKLTKDRAQSADVLEKPSLRGTKDSVVEKYSDQAHFIYELLQNADDAGATHARFTLELDQLIFAHNGDKHFSVSNPDNEDADSQNGTLGHVNAITSIANSNKSTASIGKFGVGFKAVFQYTTTPYIYDSQIKFKIERFIVPIQLPKDFHGRKKDETLFIFPFNHPNRNSEEAYDDISEKLRNLVYPVLFLRNLQSVDYIIAGEKGSYSRKMEESFQREGTKVDLFSVAHSQGKVKKTERIWLFTRTYEDNLQYSVGFFIDKDNKLIPVKETAFCYFPTKENTGLNFILHAPFLLTDSREGIRAGVKHNNEMVRLLANLAADSMLYLRDIGLERDCRLIDDNIINIIPVNESDFADVNDRRRISFKPIYQEIKNVFAKENILPTKTGYCNSKKAYWAEIPQITNVFSDEQLSAICGVREAHWVFCTVGRSQYVHHRNKELVSYIEDLTCTSLDEATVIKGRRATGMNYKTRKSLVPIKGLTAEFIQQQSFEWLNTFYKWISETDTRAEAVKNIPVFISQDMQTVAAYDESGYPILFLPERDIEGYVTINEDLLKYRYTKKLLEKLKVKKPVLRDQIYNIVLPQYENGIPEDTNPHFSLFFKYYKSCPKEELESFINLIKECNFLQYYTEADTDFCYGKASDLYMPSKELTSYFEPKKDTKFINIDNYKILVGHSSEKYLYQFLNDLGVNSRARLISRMVSVEEVIERQIPRATSTRPESWKEYNIDGCLELIGEIVSKKSKRKSVLLWNMLLELVEADNFLESRLTIRYTYFYKRYQSNTYDSIDKKALREKKWLFNNSGKAIAPSEVKFSELAEGYNLSAVYAPTLLKLLGITEKEIYAEEDKNLNERQRKQIELGRHVEELGYTKDDLEEFIKWKQRQKQSVDNKELELKPADNPGEETPEDTIKIPKRIDKVTSRVIKDIVGRTKRKDTLDEMSEENLARERAMDSDEFTPEAIDFSEKIEAEKKKSAAEIERIGQIESLQKKAMSAKRYSFGWFKTLLELEVLGNNANGFDNREISIRFGKIEREADTQRNIILKNPSMNIPQFMEDLSDIPLYLQMEDGTKKLIIEAINVKSYTLRVKIRSAEELSELDFSKIIESRIEAKSPVFLLSALKEEFYKLKYKENYDMQANLSKNIKFVFGPPGTGKTTYLAKNVLVPYMENSKEMKVLVLTPTNKSADVLTERIMDVMGKNQDFKKWLIRFGNTNEERIENVGVFRGREFDIRTLDKSITVTTIARFPYDFFMASGERLYLKDVKWDIIVFDEASMIPLANIVYPLYKKTPKQFIIAGDPFQIEPITTVEQWKDENIYKLVHLDSFVSPETVPYHYDVELLSTQYRCIPEIGDVFSRLTYGGILKHYRKTEEKKPLPLQGNVELAALNLIKFPVSKYESIYKAKRLQHSSCYQIYAALFAYEFVRYMASHIKKTEVKGVYKIGIIAPYRAQSDLIQKLMESSALPKHVEVSVGTIHSFQGDECDTIITVFNPPPTISASNNMFLNKQNIINVSISRARDHLVILMPDEETEKIENLRLVNRVEQLCMANGAKVFRTAEMEAMMFGKETYLEDNTFTTSHQNVNVYGIPEKCYEIRSEDSAIDIQVHKTKR